MCNDVCESINLIHVSILHLFYMPHASWGVDYLTDIFDVLHIVGEQKFSHYWHINSPIIIRNISELYRQTTNEASNKRLTGKAVLCFCFSRVQHRLIESFHCYEMRREKPHTTFLFSLFRNNTHEYHYSDIDVFFSPGLFFGVQSVSIDKCASIQHTDNNKKQNMCESVCVCVICIE